MTATSHNPTYIQRITPSDVIIIIIIVPLMWLRHPLNPTSI